jgi:FkbM family methyltransferase
MLLNFDFLSLKYDFPRRVTGVIHAGAHLAEEAPHYAGLGVPVWWIEANPAVIPIIQQTLVKYRDQRVIQALIFSEDARELPFHITNYDGMSSSILNFGTHTSFSPDTVFVSDVVLTTSTIDSLVLQHSIQDVNMLVMDLQGVERSCLIGAENLLPHLDFVMSEVNEQEVYEGCTKIWELDALLLDFDRVETSWVPDQGWGDALWVRR